MISTETKVSGTELVERASKAFLREAGYFYSTSPTSKSGSYELVPDYPFYKVLDLIKNDSIAWGAIITLLDRTLEGGWTVNDTYTGARKEDIERNLKNKGFDFWLREMLLHYIIFNNSFGEIVSTEGGLKELWAVDPTDIRIRADEHGEVIEYYQLPPSNALWQPEQILHVHDASIKLNTYGDVGTKTIYQAILVKYHIKKFMLWLFETNQFRGIHKLTSVDETAIKNFFTYMRRAEQDITKPIVLQGEHEYVVGRSIEELKTLNDLMYKMDEEILNLLQVPPIYAGLPDNSNRSNSDAQERALFTRVKSIHKLFEHFLRELLNRLGHSKCEVRFNLPSLKLEKEVFESAQIMKDLGLTNKVIENFLRKNRIELPDGEVFNPPPEMMVGGESGGRPETMYPSRRRKGVDQPNKKIGTGDDATTRPEQVQRAFNNYPYVWEVEDNAI